MAVKGNTPFEPNHISVEAENGTLKAVGDGNTGYYFQFGTVGVATVNLITKVDMIIDGHSVPADTLIYQLWIFYDPDADIHTAYSIGLSYLIPPEEEQGQSIAEQSGISTEESPSKIQSQPVNDCNSLPLTAVRQEKRKTLLNCPNSFDEITHVRTAREKPEFLAMPDDSGGQLMLDGTIEVSSDITTNQIWTAGNTYYITADISVQALLVIEPGTTVMFSSGTSMYVNNGGTLISAGTPDNPIIYTSDSLDPWYGDYYAAIVVEETASASTKITYNYIEYAEIGIWVMNNRLDSPIENNYLYSNSYGILEYGTEHTDIYNNLIYASYNYAIEVHMSSYDNQADSGSHILIQNNTCDYYQDVGIIVFGVANSDDAGEVILSNNIVSGAYQYGLVLANGYMYYTIDSTGYYDNTANTYDTYDQTNPVIETTMPYVNGTGILPICYLRPNSVFVNASDEYIEQTRLIGKTTDINGFPDSNKADLGFHYPNWHFSNAGEGSSLPMDLNADLIVNFKDFAILAAGWRITYNIGDLNVMADEWLKTATNPPIAVTISGDPNNLAGESSIGVNGYGITTESVFVLIDGEYIDKLEYFNSNTPLLLDTDSYRNGSHSIKVVAVDINGLITVSNTLDVNFNNTFYSIIASDYFHPTTDYKILGFHNGTGSFEVKIADYDNQIIWSNSYSGANLNIVVPGVAFGSEQFCEFSISETGSFMMATAGASGASGGSGAAKKDLMKKFKQTDCPANVEMVIVLPNKDVFNVRLPAILECARACDRRNVPWVSLYYHDVTEDNLRFLYNFSSVKYVYWCGHANWKLQGVERTFTECWKYESSGWWDIIDNWHKIGVFSWTGGLPDDWDTRGFSLWSLPMHDQWNKKIVFVDGCFSAKKPDMAEAYGVFSLQGQGSLDQIYIGWRIEVLVSTGIMENIIGNTTEGVRMFWERMGYDDSVMGALEYTSNNGGAGMQRALWGLNGIPDLGDEQGDDNLFLWGLGFINLNQIKLER